MRLPATLVFTLILICGSAACAQAAAESKDASTHPVTDFLLTKTAADFHAQRPAVATRFHDVRAGHVATTHGSPRRALCEQFTPAPGNGPAGRAFFISIESPGGPNGYDLIIEGDEPRLCQQPTFVQDRHHDTTAVLQAWFDHMSPAS